MSYTHLSKVEQKKRNFARKLIRANDYEDLPWLVTKFMESVTNHTCGNCWENLFDSVVHINEKYLERANMVCNKYLNISAYSYNHSAYLHSYRYHLVAIRMEN